MYILTLAGSNVKQLHNVILLLLFLFINLPINLLTFIDFPYSFRLITYNFLSFVLPFLLDANFLR